MTSRQSQTIEKSTKTHFKGLIVLYLDVEAQGRDSTFTFSHTQLKKAILLHKRAIGPLLLLFCVGAQVIFNND